MAVDLLLELDNSIIKDLEENYKNKIDGYGLDYFSVKSDLFTDNLFLDKIDEFGCHYFLFQCYLKTQMLSGGRYYFLEKSIKRIINNYSNNYHCDIELVNKIYADLIHTKTIFLLEDKNYFEGKIITDPYIIYNYQRTLDKREYNRIKKREERARKNAEKDKDKEIPTAPLMPATTSLEDDFTEADI